MSDSEQYWCADCEEECALACGGAFMVWPDENGEYDETCPCCGGQDVAP